MIEVRERPWPLATAPLRTSGRRDSATFPAIPSPTLIRTFSATPGGRPEAWATPSSPSGRGNSRVTASEPIAVMAASTIAAGSRSGSRVSKMMRVASRKGREALIGAGSGGTPAASGWAGGPGTLAGSEPGPPSGPVVFWAIIQPIFRLPEADP